LKRKFLGITLLICFVAPLVATFAILQFQKYQIRKEVKGNLLAEMNMEELVLLKFSENEIQTQLFWENPKEFEYKDQMYDVVKTDVKNGITYYYCWPDDKETKLNKELDELLAFTLGNNPNQNEGQKKISVFFKSLYFSKYNQEPLYGFSEERSAIFFYTEKYQSQYAIPIVPPPKIS
jgi:hypothetical protein